MRPRTLRWRGRLVLAASSLILTLVLAEVSSSIALSWLKPRPEPPPELVGKLNFDVPFLPTEPHPFLNYRMQADFRSDPVRTNEYGLRNDAVEPTPGEDTLRILLLGGSTAWGYSSRSNEDTLAALLEEWFAEHGGEHAFVAGREVEVLNGAVPGYVSWQCAVAYALDRFRLRPHVVVSLDGSNDVTAAITNQRAGTIAYPDVPRIESLGQALGGWGRHVLSKLKCRKLYHRLSPPRHFESFGAPAPEVVAGAYRAALETLSDAASRDGAVTVAVLQPMNILPGAKPPTDFEKEMIAAYETPKPGRIDYFDRCFAAFRTMLAELEREREAFLGLDATGIFANETGMVFTDHCHLTSLGREQLAAWIGANLAEYLDRVGG